MVTNINGYMKMVKASASESTLFADAEAESLREAVIEHFRQGTLAMRHEMTLLHSPWDFPLSHIRGI